MSNSLAISTDLLELTAERAAELAETRG